MIADRSSQPWRTTPDVPHAAPFVNGGILLGVLMAALLVGAVAVIDVFLAIGLIAAGTLFVVTFMRPQTAAYVYLALTPLLVGISRGTLLPVIRPSEGILLVVGSALVARFLVRLLQGERFAPTFSRFDVAFGAVVMLGSVISLGWMAARGLRPSQDDILHGMAFWKYLALYLVVRSSITTKEQVRRCVWIVLGVSAVVAIIGALQASGVGGFDSLVAKYYAPNGNVHLAVANRGTSTIAHSIAMGDVMAMSLALSLAALFHGHGRRWLTLSLAVLFLIGGVGSGQFSGVIALVVAIVTVGILTRRLGKLYLAAVPSFVIVSLLLAPVVSRRLGGFGETEEGLPPSWVGRWDNLSDRVWPRLMDGSQYILGVRTSPRIQAWEAWRDYVYIESGHTWLLWVGGIPLLLAFLYFSWIALRATSRIARSRTDMIGVVATGAATGAAIVFVLTLLDNHLTLRGTADLWFPLLALSFISLPPQRADEKVAGSTTVRDGGRGLHVASAP